MLLAVWIGLAVGVVATVAGIAVAVTRAFRAWRTFRRVMRHTSAQLEALARHAAATEEKAVAATGNAAKLAAAVERLQRSLAVLAVLRAAAAEAGAPIRGVRNAVPRK